MLTVLKKEVGCEVVAIVLRGAGTGRTERDERELTEGDKQLSDDRLDEKRDWTCISSLAR